MSSISEINIVTGLLIPVALYLIKKVIDWAGKVFGSPKPKRKHQFDKIPADKKVEIFAKIDELKGKALTPYALVQIKLLHEQLGIYLPVWHCHQLISFITSENISSLDVRLRGFLKNTIIGIYPEKGFSVNAKAVRRTCIIDISFGVIAVATFVYAGWDAISTFWQSKETGFFILFLLIYASAIFTVIGYVISQIEDIYLGSKFGHLFETWLRNNPPCNNETPDTSVATPTEEQGASEGNQEDSLAT
ncbi:hypothetical protein JWT41_003595 [Salmonella enterica subsp. enterica serovar Arechavaleta]|uniref:Uncharacterized protein n=1 Tax=Salmonella enterica TaxID=28901 RepID=A0A755V400_SALER|nr:hypothetical protein [Salmonella enterica subsp. enterica serovar Arechavaleta]EAO6400842.1 hypothetical protein [Salmonella enterica]EBF8683555.1 hypothetical protein [Salmonella enterica subsp. enterica]EDB4403584.1 hypothetical protein [Salmonella enterica subsp. enterica serovar Schwarzengrund]EAW0407454.1 hypothetical protein [Salmonella enterica]